MKTELNAFVKVDKPKKVLVFDYDAIEALDLDVAGSKIIFFTVDFPERKREKTELYVVKINSSFFEDESLAEHILTSEDGHKGTIYTLDGAEEGSNVNLKVEDSVINALNVISNTEDEYKLLPCYVENNIIKEVKSIYDIKHSYFKIVPGSSKKNSVGTNKDVIEVDQVTEEKISLK